MIKMRRWFWIGCVGCVAGGGGCTHLAYVNHTSVGVDVGAAPTEGNVKLVVGIDRTTVAVVPKTDPGSESDAMSVVAASQIRVAGIREARFRHVIVTGQPAVLVAQDPEEFSKTVDKVFYKSPEKTPADAAKAKAEELAEKVKGGAK